MSRQRQRGLLEEEWSEDGEASPLEGLDLTEPGPDPFEQQGGGEWQPPEPEAAEGSGEWQPPVPRAAYADQPQEAQSYAQPHYEQERYQQHHYQEPEPPQDPVLDETERRFAMYGYYRDLIQQPFFQHTGDPLAVQVERELHAFVRSRMAALLSNSGEEAPAGLDQDEVRALKFLAQSAIRQAGGKIGLQAKPQGPPPAARRAPPVRAGYQAPQRQQAPVRRQQPPPAPAAPPPRAQVRRAPAQPQTQQAARQPARQEAPPRSPKGGVPPHETEVEENGIKYRWYHLEAQPNEFGPGSEMLMRKLPVGMHMKLPNGVLVVRNNAEEWTKVIKKTVTNTQVRDRGQMPFPKNMSAITHSIASSQVDGSLAGLARKLG